MAQSIKGTHEAKKTDEDVEVLVFIDTLLTFLPHGLHSRFPQLTKLRVLGCGLKAIRARNLMGLDNLEELWLPNNSLNSLPDDLFIHTIKLKRIDFSNNQLEFLSSRLFDPLTESQLEHVSFLRNTVIDLFYSPEAIKGSDHFKKFKDFIDLVCSPSQMQGKLTKNKFNVYSCVVSDANHTTPGALISIRGDHVKNHTVIDHDVKKLEFTWTTVHYFPRGIQKLFVHLKELIIDNCELKEIVAMDLMGLENLQHLWIENNCLQTVPSDLFAHTERLTHIGISDYNLKTIGAHLLDSFPNFQLEYLSFRNGSAIKIFYWPKYEGEQKTKTELITMIQSFS